jgi:hypothetical protein
MYLRIDFCLTPFHNALKAADMLEQDRLVEKYLCYAKRQVIHTCLNVIVKSTVTYQNHQ